MKILRYKKKLSCPNLLRHVAGAEALSQISHPKIKQTKNNFFHILQTAAILYSEYWLTFLICWCPCPWDGQQQVVYSLKLFLKLIIPLIKLLHSSILVNVLQLLVTNLKLLVDSLQYFFIVLQPLVPNLKQGLGICSLVFWANCWFFLAKERHSHLLLEKSEWLSSLFCIEQREQIDYAHSFVMSYGRDSPMVTLL